MYCAIIGDMVDSQKIPAAERAAVQRKLEHLLTNINKRYSTHISANFVITLGDEFQGLLHEAAYSLPLMRQLIKNMYPYKIRLGVGLGDINTKIDPQKALGADGSAYHCARKALVALKAQGMPAAAGGGPAFLVRFESGAPDTLLLNLSCGFIQSIMSRWTAKQWAVIKAVLEHEQRQKEAAAQLGLAKSTVSRNLRAARYGEYQAALAELGAYLKDTYDATVTASVRLQQAENLIASAAYLADVQKDYALALEKQLEALAIRKAVLRPPDERIAESLDQVGGLYLLLGQARAALEHFEKAVMMREGARAERRPEKLAQGYKNMGQAFLAMGDLRQALSCYQKSLSVWEKAAGKEHAQRAEAYSGLTEVYYQQGEYEKALEHCQQARLILEKTLGEKQPQTISVYHSLARIYDKQEKHHEAAKWWKKAGGGFDKK